MASGSQVAEEIMRPRSGWGGWARPQRETVLLGLLLVVAVLGLYYPVGHYPFIDWDDPGYVSQNPQVLGPLDWSIVLWAFTHPYCHNYDPLTFLSHSLDVRMFDLDAGRHHQVNVILHAMNVILLFWVLKRATACTGRSFMVAALFALHPINVENVAWIAERKTMLSVVFFLMALGAYRWYAREPKLRRMAVVAFLYGLGLMSKPQVIVLPFLLLLWDYWPLRRMFAGAADSSGATEIFPPRKFAALVKEKIPLFLIAAVDAVLTVVAQNVAATQQILPYTFGVRLGNAIDAYFHYLKKAVWPTGLALEYLYRGYSLKWWEVLTASLVLVAVTALVVAKRRRRYLVVGWLWFLGSLIPTIGLVVQPHLDALADRYAYTPFIGLFLMVCWGVADWAAERHLSRALLPATSIAVLLALSLLTYRQVGYWGDKVKLWTHTVEVTHRNWLAEIHLAGAAREQGRTTEALAHLHRAEEDQPLDHGVNLTIALIEHERRNLREAIKYYERVVVVSSDPNDEDPQVLINMGHAYSDLGDNDRAQQCYRAALHSRSAPQRPAIDWHGAWWRDLGPAIQQYFRRWRWQASSPSQ